jgi:HSP20 family protein
MPRSRRETDRLHDEIQELFADLWQVPRFSGMRHGFRPQVDAFRTADPPLLQIVVELPGVDPDAVQVVVADRTLVIAGERPRPRIDGQVWQQMEIEYGPFQRRFQLPEDVEPGEASAEYDRGLLRIAMPIVDRRRGPLQVPIAVRARGS